MSKRTSINDAHPSEWDLYHYSSGDKYAHTRAFYEVEPEANPQVHDQSEESVPYKFNEGQLIAEFKDYIDSTYDGHYSKNKFQSTEFIIDCDHGLGFTLGNVLKYTQRYGKKEGHNRKDLLKILHYALIALSIHDDNFEN
jgi:hypothetical protein